MYTPDKTEFAKYADSKKLVPVYRQLMSDSLTPVLALEKLASSRYSFLLESVTGGEKIGRYSFLGIRPSRIFRAVGRHVTILDPFTGHIEMDADTPSALDTLQEMLAHYEAVHLPGLPRFMGGAVGYFGYDVIRQIENLPNAPERSLHLPDIYLGLYDTMLIFDNVSKTVKVISHADCRDGECEEAYHDACDRVDEIVELLRVPGTVAVEDVPAPAAEEPQLESNFEKEEFKRAVEKCKEYITAGDIFQVVLSQRLRMPCKLPPLKIYRHLRVINPSPYMFYLQFPELQLVGSSPEVMVRVEDDRITVRPIAGTRKRGKSEAEDAALAEDMLADPKECAEHTMLLDLGRNDVGRVSEYGQVKITEQMTVERYSHVMHIVSNVEGRLRKGLSSLEAFKACIPAGTVSGAPKVRAMQIIDELEPDVRGPYAGAVGYLDFSGNLDTCIAIRTLVLHDGYAYVQAGAGIVADSVPEMEYQETRNKARAVLKAIQSAEQHK